MIRGVNPPRQIAVRERLLITCGRPRMVAERK